MAEFVNNIVPHVKIYKKRFQNIDSNNFKSLYGFSKVNVDWLNDYLFGPEKIKT